MSKTRMFHTDKPVECRVTEVGRIPGAKVTAATDAAGAQVIVKGRKIHLLSRPLANHAAAVALAKQIVDAQSTDIYREWFDLKSGGIGVGLFAIFGGPFRGSDPPPDALDKVAKKFFGKGI